MQILFQNTEKHQNKKLIISLSIKDLLILEMYPSETTYETFANTFVMEAKSLHT